MIAIPSLLLNNWKLIVMGGLLAALAVQTWRIGNLKEDIKAEKALHQLDIEIWTGAANKARAEALELKQRVEGEQAAITQRIEHETRTGIDAVRSKYDKLLATAKTNLGSGGKAHLRYDLDCLGITPEASICDGLLAYRERVGRLAEQAELNTVQLNKLIDAYEAQSSINRSGE